MKNVENPRKFSKAAQKRYKALGPQSCLEVGAVLSRSWDALGPPQAVPNAAKSAKIWARSQIFAFFSNVIFRINFRIDFLSIFRRSHP